MPNWDQYDEATTMAADDTLLFHDVSETVVGKKMKRIKSSNVVSEGATKIIETSGPTTLAVGAIADGEYLMRSGTTVVSGSGGSGITIADIEDAGFVPVDMIGGVPHKQIWVGNAKPTMTNGCATTTQIEMATNKNVYDVLAFDASSIEYAYANIALPQDYTGGTIYAKFYWSHPETTTNFKVSWGLQGVSAGDDDTLDVASGSAVYANDTGGTTNDLYISPITTEITISGTPVAGKLLQLRISRKADDATNDTLSVDAYLIGVMIWYPVG